MIQKRSKHRTGPKLAFWGLSPLFGSVEPPSRFHLGLCCLLVMTKKVVLAEKNGHEMSRDWLGPKWIGSAQATLPYLAQAILARLILLHAAMARATLPYDLLIQVIWPQYLLAQPILAQTIFVQVISNQELLLESFWLGSFWLKPFWRWPKRFVLKFGPPHRRWTPY